MAAWLLGFGLVVYLGLKAGATTRSSTTRSGIAIWWILLVRRLCRRAAATRLSPLAWVALGLLGAFAAWTAFSLSWTESTERTSADLARMASYLGVFALALFVCDSRGARRDGRRGWRLESP